MLFYFRRRLCGFITGREPDGEDLIFGGFIVLIYMINMVVSLPPIYRHGGINTLQWPNAFCQSKANVMSGEIIEIIEGILRQTDKVQSISVL